MRIKITPLEECEHYHKLLKLQEEAREKISKGRG